MASFSKIFLMKYEGCVTSDISYLLKSNYAKQFSSLQITQENHFELLAEAVTPLWKTEYSKQLKIKELFSQSIIKTLKNSMKTPKIHPIVASPSISEYRNKDEFCIRSGVDGDPKTVGFFIGSHKDGNVTCVPPKFLSNIQKKHIVIAEIYQEFIRKSQLSACHDLHDRGYWRNLLVRSNLKGDTIISVMAHPLGALDGVIEESKEKLKQHFCSSDVDLKCLYFQLCPHTRCSGESYPFEILYGSPFLFEELKGLKFRISPASFFQVNTALAELMFEAALGFLKLSSKSTLLDLCCGIGSLSIIASNRVRGCVGIECSSESVQDAIFSANLNGINNCSFLSGRVEEKLPLVVKSLELSSEVIAVVNPGRAGIGKEAIKAIRKCFQLRRLVYISCKADNKFTLQNFRDLCNPKFDSSPPFTITDVMPFDMFPQTNHCEILFVFKR